MKNLFAISFIYFFINSVYCQSLEQIIAKNKKSKGNKPYTIRGYRPYHNTQKVIKGFDIFQLGCFTKNNLNLIKNCDSIYHSFVIPKERYEIYEHENIVVLNNKSYEIVDKNSYFNNDTIKLIVVLNNKSYEIVDTNSYFNNDTIKLKVKPKYKEAKYIQYLIEYFDISTRWWKPSGIENKHNDEDLKYIFKDIDVYHIHNYKFNDYHIIHINLLFYKNILIGIYVEHNKEWHDAFELKYPNHFELEYPNIDTYQYDYPIYLTDEYTLFYNRKYLGYNGIIENKITEINKKLFLKKTKNLKGFNRKYLINRIEKQFQSDTIKNHQSKKKKTNHIPQSDNEYLYLTLDSL
jgi:hypothetical protein